LLCDRSARRRGGQTARVVDHLAAPGHAIEVARALAERLAALPRPAAAATKRVFMPAISGMSEALDAKANAAFADNCRHAVARATLEKFGSR
jgi:enoyl-CoA hydratase/carnithine racemase